MNQRAIHGEVLVAHQPLCLPIHVGEEPCTTSEVRSRWTDQIRSFVQWPLPKQNGVATIDGGFDFYIALPALAHRSPQKMPYSLNPTKATIELRFLLLALQEAQRNKPDALFHFLCVLFMNARGETIRCVVFFLRILRLPRSFPLPTGLLPAVRISACTHNIDRSRLCITFCP